MNNQPLIKQGWLRVTLFVFFLLGMIFLLTIGAGYLVTALNINEAGSGSNENAQDTLIGRSFLVKFLVSAILSSLITVFIFRRFVDRRPFVTLGLEWKNYGSHGATGFFLATLLLGIGSFILLANKNLEWTNVVFEGNELFIGLGLLILVAFTEEIVFRGYVLNNLMQSMNKWIALVLSALLFALFHSNNPGTTPIVLINIFLAGLLLGINYIYTKNLWFAILFHFSWNFFEGSVLGYKVSGWNLQSVLEHELSGNPLLTGGDFGFEGSLVVGGLSLLAVLVLAWVYERKALASQRSSATGQLTVGSSIW